MAVTKVSSAAHFISRATGVRGREGAVSGHWVPNTDVYVTDTGLVIKVELAGMKSNSLEITVEGNRIRISGNRPDCCRASKCSFLVMEISYGTFESVLELAFCGLTCRWRASRIPKQPRCQSLKEIRPA
jgi:HSP20 family protein